MKLKKITVILLLTIWLVFSLPTAALAEDTIIPEGIPTEEADENTDYTVYERVKPVSASRDFASAPFARFTVSEDGKNVALLFESKEKTTVSVFTVQGEELEFSHGFDIILPETAIARISGENILVWLKESGVIFAVDAKGALQEIKKLKKDVEAEDGGGAENSEALNAVKELFGSGTEEITVSNGSRFTPSDTVTAEGITAFTRLTVTNPDGNSAILYATTAIPKAVAPTAAVLGGITAILAVAAVATEIAFAVRKKAEGAGE